NWYYTGLPANFWLRQFGYAWSFATIWPAIFEAADLFDVWRARRPPATLGQRTMAVVASPGGRRLWMAVGLAFLIWPLAWPSRYLAAPVWLGFILLLDPINKRLGEASFIEDGEHASFRRMSNLMLSG